MLLSCINYCLSASSLWACSPTQYEHRMNYTQQLVTTIERIGVLSFNAGDSLLSFLSFLVIVHWLLCISFHCEHYWPAFSQSIYLAVLVVVAIHQDIIFRHQLDFPFSDSSFEYSIFSTNLLTSKTYGVARYFINIPDVVNCLTRGVQETVLPTPVRARNFAQCCPLFVLEWVFPTHKCHFSLHLGWITPTVHTILSWQPLITMPQD